MLGFTTALCNFVITTITTCIYIQYIGLCIKIWTNVLESDQSWKKWIDASLVTFHRMFFFLLLSQQKLFDWDGAAAVERHKDPSGWWWVSADLGRPLLDAQRTKLQYLNSRFVPTGFCLLLQRFYGEHSRSDSCLQTCVSSGDVVSNIQVLMKSVLKRTCVMCLFHLKYLSSSTMTTM